MVNIISITKAIEERKPLFYPGAEIDKEAYEFLCKQTAENIDMLFADMPPTKTKKPSYLHVHFKCQRCLGPMTVKLTKSQFKQCRTGGLSVLMERYCEIRANEEREIIHDLSFLNIEKGVKNLKGVCNDCIRSLKKKINDKYGEFYNDPLLWVNTHNPENHCWQWNRVVKLYAYPLGYEKRPDGWKYCGVRIKNMDSRGMTDYMDTDYYNWKTIKDKTVVEKRLTSTREILNELLGDLKKADEIPAALKKAINIAEVFIEGLASKTDLSSLIEYVSKESSRLMEKMKKNSSPSRILNFGKYKGMSIHAVIEIDPEYIYWALTVVEGFSLTDDELAHYNGEEWEHLVPVNIMNLPSEELVEEEDESYKTEEPLIKEEDSSTHSPLPF